MKIYEEIATEKLLDINGGVMLPWHDYGLILSPKSSVDAVLK
ncbi:MULTISPECIES: hypothetical protein [Streptococcus]|nr:MULTISPECIES: hypothetical protein [Streptococcus]MDY4762229.1 hypothetical protein [Streptococcus thoraltensis]